MKTPFPSPPSNLPEGTVGFGGPIPWFSISLSITADDLDPDRITRLLGVAPDVAERREVAVANGRRIASFGRWSIGLRREQVDEGDVGVAIGLLLDRVPAPTDAWEQACADTKARVFVGLHLDDFNRGFDLPIELMRRLSDRGLRLDFDIYWNDQDKTNEPMKRADHD